jgi:3-deoxy-manno-octulosonate cytidylyltransferase (CMP-KDO synthetase)
MSSVAIVIPARMNSTRLPQKAMADIEGKPMVVRVAEQARLVPGVNQIIVATDHQRIADAVTAAGFLAVMTPASLNSGSERVAFVAKTLKEEIVVNVQGDEPLIAPESIQAALHPVKEGKAPIGSVFTPFHSMRAVQEPQNVKVITDREGFALWFSRASMPFRQGMVSDEELLGADCFGKHLGVYAYRRQTLLDFASWEQDLLEKVESLEQLRALRRGVKIAMGRTAFDAQSVDTQEDLERARQLFRMQQGGRSG